MGCVSVSVVDFIRVGSATNGTNPSGFLYKVGEQENNDAFEN